MSVTKMTRTVADKFKEAMLVPFKELKISETCSFLFFEIGAEPYYIKIVG